MLRKINLQLFAGEEMGDDSGAANPPSTEGDVTPQAGDGSTESKEKDPAKAFAARLGHERKKLESEYSPYKTVIERQAKAAGMDPKDYLEYISKQQEQEELEAEADRTGKTPEELRALKEANDAKARLAQFERKEKLTTEEKELVGDPKIGKFVSDNLDRIREIAEGSDTDLRTGLAIVLTEKLPELLEKADPEKQREQIIREYTESLRKGGKPIEIGGGAASVSNNAPTTFEDAKKASIAMIKAMNSK